MTRAWAEGMVVRSLLSPLLFPLKMWTAFYFVSDPLRLMNHLVS